MSSDYYRDGLNVVYDLDTDYSEYILYGYLSSIGGFEKKISSTVLNNWHHIVFIRKGQKTYHYSDGIFLEETTYTDVALNMQHNWYIGTFSGNNPYYHNGEINYNFDGVIDDIRIYSKAISLEDINQLFLAD